MLASGPTCYQDGEPAPTGPLDFRGRLLLSWVYDSMEWPESLLLLSSTRKKTGTVTGAGCCMSPSMHRSRRDGPPSVPGRWGWWLGPREGRCVSHSAGAQDARPRAYPCSLTFGSLRMRWSLCLDLSAAGVPQGVSHQTVNEDWCL